MKLASLIKEHDLKRRFISILASLALAFGFGAIVLAAPASAEDFPTSDNFTVTCDGSATSSRQIDSLYHDEVQILETVEGVAGAHVDLKYHPGTGCYWASGDSNYMPGVEIILEHLEAYDGWTSTEEVMIPLNRQTSYTGAHSAGDGIRACISQPLFKPRGDGGEIPESYSSGQRKALKESAPDYLDNCTIGHDVR